MHPPSLRVLVVAAGPEDARFAERVLTDHGDQVAIAGDVTDALNQLTREHFDVALVSLSLPRGDGLALVHHVRALHPEVDVVVMTAQSDLADTAHALALGVLQNVMLPLTGDALLVAADRARERRVLVSERARLAAEGASSRRRTATYARCAAFVAETDATAVAKRVLDACVAECDAVAGAIYMPAYFGASELTRVAHHGSTKAVPPRMLSEDLSDLDPTQIVDVSEDGTRVQVLLMGQADVAAIVSLRSEKRLSKKREINESLEVVAALGTAALTAARKVDAIARAGIKDPETSAYTFAYFGDVAGREIDRAARHGRRFALLTISLDGVVELRARLDQAGLIDMRRTLSDALLETVRDSDVLARVEDDEYYLLLPETGLLGALAARRRVENSFRELGYIDGLEPGEKLEPIVGIAVYPSDGADLGRLLRVSRARSDRSRESVARRLGIEKRPFWEAIDALLGDEDASGIAPDGTVTLHADLANTHDALSTSRHATFSPQLLQRAALTLVQDAIQQRAVGTLYAAGDDAMIAGIVDAVSRQTSPIRAWILGGGDASAQTGAGLRLPVDDARLERQVLLIALTEVGGYVLVARPIERRDGTTLLTYHASDLDLVDGLMASLQTTYHLQPEVRT